jgi:hypothetical protein
MPRAVPVPVRQAILRRQQQGQEPRSIAAELHLPLSTVRHLLHRLPAGATPEQLQPAWHRCGRRRADSQQPLVDLAIHLRREHPRWGAGRIRIALAEKSPGTLPSERTLQRWLAQADLQPAPPGRPARAALLQAQRPHEIWQVDASEDIPLLGGKKVLLAACHG